MNKQKIIVILGQTATGKSSLAVKIATRLNSKILTSRKNSKNGAEIISADSRQVYKHLDIGTGKITKKEMRGIPHHLINIANPKSKFTVVEYKKLVDEKIKDIISRNKIPIICGGTGFYIDAITKGIVFPEVPPDLKLRKSLDKKSSLQLYKILEKLDKNRAKDIKNKNELNNKVRLIRAIEIAKTLGKVPEIKSIKPMYKFIKIGLYLQEPKLKNKIENRVKEMFDKKNNGGLLKEIQKLKKIGITKKRLQEFGFEYNEPTYEKVVSESIKYAKRQLTWFKRDKEIKWFKADKLNLTMLFKHLK